MREILKNIKIIWSAIIILIYKTKNCGILYIKLINISSGIKSITLNTNGITINKLNSVVTLKSDNLYNYNSMTNPRLISPTTKELAVNGKKINIAVDPVSVNVVVLS